MRRPRNKNSLAESFKLIVLCPAQGRLLLNEEEATVVLMDEKTWGEWWSLFNECELNLRTELPHLVEEELGMEFEVSFKADRGGGYLGTTANVSVVLTKKRKWPQIVPGGPAGILVLRVS